MESSKNITHCYIVKIEVGRYTKTKMEQNNPDITYLAKTNFRGTDKVFGIKRKDRRQHMYVLGKSGTGKSTLLENMLIQNIQNGEGLCVIDPHGELVEKIVTCIPKERAEDVIYFNPSDTDFAIGFNVLQVDDPKYKHLIASGLMGIFTKIWANTWSSRMEYIMNNCILALLDTPGSTLMGIPRLLVDKDYRQYVISNLKDPVVKAFWIHEFEAWRDQFRNEAIQPIQNKVGQFLSSNIVRNIVGQQKSTINIFDIMNTQKIFLVNLSKGRMGEDNSALLGAMLITKIQLAAMERVRIPETDRKDFYLYVDEFQNFVTDSFASILSEARKYRLNLTIAHQYIAQLETSNGSAVKDAVFGNVGTMIVFRVGADDGSALEGEFEPEFVTEDFVNLPNYHIYLKLMVDGVTSRPFSARTLPPIPVQESEEIKELIIETSRRLYAKPRAQIENDIDRWSSSVPGALDDENAIGKFKAECLGCKKQIYVPFEPIPGRPIYCKDCMVKIKVGELTPVEGFRLPKSKNDVVVSYDALSTLGIEFNQSDPTKSKKPPFKERNKIVQPVSSESGQRKPVQKTTQNSMTRQTTSFIKQQTPSMKHDTRSGAPTQGARQQHRSDLSEKNDLKSILSSVVNEVRRSPVTSTTQSHSDTPVTKNEISLKELLVRESLQRSTAPVVDTKIARPESVNSLKESIASILQKQKVHADSYKEVTPNTVSQDRQQVSVHTAGYTTDNRGGESMNTGHSVNTSLNTSATQQAVPHTELHKIFE
jgi:CxxC-x17-CxxC domain-containing protein